MRRHLCPACARRFVTCAGLAVHFGATHLLDNPQADDWLSNVPGLDDQAEYRAAWAKHMPLWEREWAMWRHPAGGERR